MPKICAGEQAKARTCRAFAGASWAVKYKIASRGTGSYLSRISRTSLRTRFYVCKIHSHSYVKKTHEMPNITIHMDDETHRKAKIYSAKTGESLSKLFREYIMKVSSENIVSPNREILEKYSSLKISAKDAMSLLNMQCLEELLTLTSTEGLPLPHLDRKSATSMANKFLKAVQHKEDSHHA